jgi:predicted permease
LLLAYWGASFVERVPLPVPARIGLTPDARLAGISFAISFVAAVLFTVMSASKGLGRHIQNVLASSAATLAPKTGAQAALVVAQVALSCLLLTVSGLLLRSALNIERIDVGFDAVNGVIGMIGLSDQGYTAATGDAFYRRLQEDLANQPQIEAVALGWLAPLAPMRAIGSFSSADASAMPSRYNVVGSRYFATLRIPLVAGREFEATDRQTSEPVAIVNETLAARYHGDAVGETLTMANEPSARRIVGVVREIKYNGIAEPPQPFVYLPLAQVFRPDVYVHVRTRTPGAQELLRNRLRALDRNVALSDVHTLSEQIDEARVTPRASASFSVGAAFIAVCLALVGVYGVLATSVDRRQRELAIRAALGAARSDMMKGVMLEGMRLTVAGLALGMLASVAAGRVLTDLLYGVPSRDATVFALVPLVILGVSVCAWIAPARRAASLDPVAILNSH